MTQNTLWQPSDISTEAGAEGGEQDSPKRRGRIPQSAWPQILERYRAGATLSAIAREFECTPSAISYIVRKAEASGALSGDAPTADTPADAAPPAAEAPAAAPAPAPVAETPAPARAPRRAAAAAEAPRPAAPAPVAEAAPAAAKPVEAPRPADPPKTRLELKREEPRPAPTPAPAPAPTAAPAPAATSASEAPAAAPAPRPAGARPEPTPPVDETEARLRETARGCLAAYRTWRQQPGQGSIQALSDAVHDLRKVLARIEIDMSVSRRDEQVARPIPIPAHRAARRPQ
ncbi:hypothetical protein [Azospirillum sp.]|uniref:hypothetical protein n=1 Tax=Azospirillum sp. TaxID=34012 RepID=UPI003D75E0B9